MINYVKWVCRRWERVAIALVNVALIAALIKGCTEAIT
jgi:hypothetical protein